MKFYQKLKSLRESKNLSFQQLADKAEVSKTVIWQYENNRANPSAEIIKKLAIFFNVTTDYLLFDEEEKVDLPKISNDKISKMISSIQKLKPDDIKYLEKTIEILLERNNK